jgi:vacuolar protein sorting-associated protein 8
MSTSSNQINVANVLEGLDLDDQFDQDLIELENNNNKEEEEEFTLESILNEKDDYENDSVLKSLQTSLSTLDTTESITQQPQTQQQKKERTQSYSNLTEKNGIVCKQASLKMISSQLVNAIERSAAGLPTVLAIAQLIAIGTSRGLILLFDSLQVLKLYITTEHHDAISAMSFNNKCDRLLAGNAAGLIFMFDTLNGKCLRQITDAHPNGNSILQLKFTDDSKLACFSDSGGSVFMLEFKRVMGVRGADSVCLFSGSRGEVCDIEPLKFEKFSETLVDKLIVSSSPTNSSVGSSSLIKKNLNNINNLFNKYSLLAMASFTKIFVITLRPKLTVLFTFPLNGNAKYLPILNWQFVIFQQNQSTETILNVPKRFITPILAAARESTIHFFQVNYYQNDTEITTDNNNTSDINNDSENNKKQNHNDNNQDSIHLHFKFIQLQKCEFKFKIYNFSWLNAKTLAILDATEKIHICDIRTSQILQTISNLSSLELVYNSTFFKSLATGGYVSQALSYAGDNACYQTVQSYLGQMFILGNYFLIILFTQNFITYLEKWCLIEKSSKIEDSDSCSHYLTDNLVLILIV